MANCEHQCSVRAAPTSPTGDKLIYQRVNQRPRIVACQMGSVSLRGAEEAQPLACRLTYAAAFGARCERFHQLAESVSRVGDKQISILWSTHRTAFAIFHGKE